MTDSEIVIMLVIQSTEPMEMLLMCCAWFPIASGDMSRSAMLLTRCCAVCCG